MSRGRVEFMRARALVVSLLAVIVASGMLSLPLANAGQPASKGPDRVQWSYILYLDADNSLDVNVGNVPVVESDYEELMSVGSSKDVAMFVFADRIDGPANLFKVLPGQMVELKDFALNGKEANMGDPMTLRALITYTFKAAPADHTVLMFWDHGSPRSVATDEHPADSLTVDEVTQALDGFHVDMIGADECNVGQIDVAYQWLRGGLDVDYLLVSETYTGWRGYPYDATLGRLVANPYMTPREASIMFIEEVQKLIAATPHMGEEVNAHAAVEMAGVGPTVASFLDLTKLLKDDMKANAGTISKSRGGANYAYGSNAANLADFRRLVELIGENSASQVVKDQVALVLASFDKTVIAVQTTNTLDHQISGLGIVFPNHSWETSAYYWGYYIMQDGWQAFLESYWAAAGSI